MSSSTHIQPRRRAAANNGPSIDHLSAPHSRVTPWIPSSKDMSLRKGATFHSPTSPSSPVDDPILNVRSLPSRSLTSPKDLDDLVTASEKRVADLLETFDRSFSGLGQPIDTDLAHKDVLPVPSFILAHAASHSDLMDRPSKDSKATQRQTAHRHGSDSGLGTSVSTSPRQRTSTQTVNPAQALANEPNSPAVGASSLSSSSVYSNLDQTEKTNTRSQSTVKPKAKPHRLGEYATKQIKLHVIEPLLQEETLKEYHPLVKGLPDRIEDQSITCLRDLEKTLIFLAPVSVDFSEGESILAHCFLRAKSRARSATSYLKFCETSIQCLHTAAEHLNDIDQRRPTDRPYTNNYFVDLVEQVRAYARIMAVSREKRAKGEKLDDSDYTHGEKIQLHGGISEDGKPAELVRAKADGKTVRIDAGHTEMEIEEDEEEIMDDDVTRSMARKRKCDIGKVEYRACRECGKVYTRPCDLTKHEKTHSRPWKCSFPDCKYAESGWPTEKERDRHINDKHMDTPDLFKCLFKGCTYTSKRESNCKQHMEKAHGWEYVRSKSKKGEKLVATHQSPPTSLVPTPASNQAFPRLSTPLSSINDSPSLSNFGTLSPVESLNPSAAAKGKDRQQANAGTMYNYSPVDGNGEAFQGLDFGTFNTGFQGDNFFLSPELSEGRRGSFGTSATGMTPTSANSSLPTTTFEETFNFQDMSCHWPPMNEYFPFYNIPTGLQQPTPAWSDFDCDFNDGLAPANANEFHPEVSPAGQLDTMFGAPAGDDAFADFAQTKPGQSVNDFTLFGTHGESSADGAAAGIMFPDIGNVGGMFDDVDMEALVYGDSK